MNLSALHPDSLDAFVRTRSAAQPFSARSTSDGFASAAKAVAASARHEVSCPGCSTRHSGADRATHQTSDQGAKSRAGVLLGEGRSRARHDSEGGKGC